MRFLILCLLLAGCAPKPPAVDELNAKEQARLQAQADREQRGK